MLTKTLNTALHVGENWRSHSCDEADDALLSSNTEADTIVSKEHTAPIFTMLLPRRQTSTHIDSYISYIAEP